MTELIQVLLLTTLAGAAMPLGGLMAQVERIHPRWLETEFRHFVIAFGGGILLSAVSLVLVPESSHVLSIPVVVASMSAGGLGFMGLDILFTKSNSPASQLAAMLTDFVPEALALGATFTTGRSTGMLLALLIGLQNLPEGFNAYRELSSGGRLSGRTVLLSFTAMTVLGPISGFLGFTVLASAPSIVAVIMLVAAGGILYSVFQDIAPQAQLSQHWVPPFGAVVGFLFGLVGELLLHA